MSIMMPSKEEKEQSINTILELGMEPSKPKKSNVLVLLKKIGIKNLFFGIGDGVFLAFVCAIVLAMIFMLPVRGNMNIRYMGLFFISPFFYLMLNGVSAWKERQNGTYEIKMACHYTLRELTALRMIFFSVLCIVPDVIVCVGICCYTKEGVELLQLIGISLSALFFYGTVTMAVLRRGVTLYGQAAVPVLWSLLCLLPVILEINMEKILSALPNVVVGIVLVAAVCCYFMQLKKYLSTSERGGIYYVIR